MTDDSPRSGGRSRTVLLLGVLWSVLVGLSLFATLRCKDDLTLEMARVRVRAALHEDDLYRRFNARHGGIYVEVGDEVAPDPTVEVVGERTRRPDGRWLRRVHHVGMSRMVHGTGKAADGEVIGHVSSLHPLRTRNAPDRWEREAIATFRADPGAEEASRLQRIEGREYMRVTVPLRTEEGCLGCHGAQGHVVGDIRGAVTLSAPLAPIAAITAPLGRDAMLAHAGLWLAGLGLLFAGTQKLARADRERRAAAAALADTRAVMAVDRGALADRRRAAERATRALGAVAAETAEGIVLFDETGRAILENPVARGQLGTGDRPGADRLTSSHPVLAAYDPALADAVVRGVAQTCRGRPTDQSWKVVPVSGPSDEALGTLVVLRDLSRIRTLEQDAEVARVHARRQEKLALAGVLATALAGELAGPLDGIFLEAGRLRGGARGEAASRALGAIVANASACRRTVHRLLEFAPLRRGLPSALDLGVPVERVARLSRARLTPRNVQVRLDCAADAPTATANADHIEQVLLNLVANAADAMPEGGGIDLRVFEEDGWAVIEVLDEGVGIPDDLREKVFEPFFTTKPPGKGTGLGLGVCRRIVEEHGGTIRISNRRGGGTRVRIALPVRSGRAPA